MQRHTAFAAGLLATGLLLSHSTPAAAQGAADATPNQMRACRSEADRRLAAYSYDQIQVQSGGRDGNVARVRWWAGNEGGECTVATNGRVLAFTRSSGPGPGYGNPEATTRVTCESRRDARQECKIPTGSQIRLVRQIGESPCRPNDTYGQGPGYLWVAEGCRGEFEVILPGIGGPPAGGATRITCLSPVNVRQECPIPSGMQARFVEQIGSTPCRLNESFGYRPGFVWVQRGCRGVFELTGSGSPGASDTALVRLTCMSHGTARENCPVAGATAVRLLKQYGSSPCRLSQTFGATSGGIWVSDGCRGEFEVAVAKPGAGGPIPGIGNGAGVGQRVICESTGQRAECRVPVGALVQLVRQLGPAACVRNSTWGTGYRAIWVNRGCRGEFEVREPR
jgi:hypothetical protein